jgi:pimeloyl-ACP methyl ester carboxylesterase
LRCPERFRVDASTLRAGLSVDASTHHDQAAALSAFRNLPTLVLAGTRDRLTPFRHTEKIAAALPNATLVRYAGAGHMVMLERVEQIADRIGELVATVRASRRSLAE